MCAQSHPPGGRGHACRRGAAFRCARPSPQQQHFHSRGEKTAAGSNRRKSSQIRRRLCAGTDVLSDHSEDQVPVVRSFRGAQGLLGEQGQGCGGGRRTPPTPPLLPGYVTRTLTEIAAVSLDDVKKTGNQSHRTYVYPPRPTGTSLLRPPATTRGTVIPAADHHAQRGHLCPHFELSQAHGDGSTRTAPTGPQRAS